MLRTERPRRGMAAAIVAALCAASVAPASAQADLPAIPKTLVDRAVDARSAADIKRDNEIALAVSKAMADAGTTRASTEIYEQRLLVTGVFNNKDAYDRFEAAVRAIKGVKRLYWQAVYLLRTDEDAQVKAGTMIDWADALAMETKAKGRLIGAAGVADVNFRVAVDAFATVYVIGRARSKEEADKAIARLKDGDGVKKVTSYIDVRP